MILLTSPQVAPISHPPSLVTSLTSIGRWYPRLLLYLDVYEYVHKRGTETNTINETIMPGTPIQYKQKRTPSSSVAISLSKRTVWRESARKQNPQHRVVNGIPSLWLMIISYGKWPTPKALYQSIPLSRASTNGGITLWNPKDQQHHGLLSKNKGCVVGSVRADQTTVADLLTSACAFWFHGFINP